MSDRIEETCSCGAEFVYVGDAPLGIGMTGLSSWRKEHIHEMPAPVAPKTPAAPETHAVTGTHHQAGPVRTGPVGRKAVGFQHTPPTERGTA